jgi:ERF superfamily
MNDENETIRPKKKIDLPALTMPKTIHARINQARETFHAKTQTKTGKNPFIGYTYFELGDFLPDALAAFHDAGLCGIISFGPEEATMKIVDVETGSVETIRTPMSVMSLKGCHPVQNLGGVQTYLRRYLWSCAIELVETSAVDASAGEPEKPKADTETLPKDKFIAKKFPPKKGNGQPAGKPTPWKGRIAQVKTVEGSSPKGPWKLFWIEMENGDSAGTFDEALAKDAEIMANGPEVQVFVEPNVRKPGTWKYLGFEELGEPASEVAEDLPWK